MAWIDYKKVYDMVPQSWIIDNLKMYKIPGEIIKFIENKLVSRTDSWRKKLNWSENPERILAGRCAITIIICNSRDATQSHTYEIHKRLQAS